ncbi:Hypothetical predicted protein [Xyrichtys novacula]|uniref:Uncharacterized protein n=1 Tax=Xyrichtys novacula TaxID=13765 RepID=A0AAV1FCD3_XYRNO|nr:Hypothetical predicted protein [Xyrichtys novacula]
MIQKLLSQEDNPSFNTEQNPSFYREDNPGFHTEDPPGFCTQDNPGFYSEDNPGFHTKQNPGYYPEDNPSLYRENNPGFQTEDPPGFCTQDNPGFYTGDNAPAEDLEDFVRDTENAESTGVASSQQIVLRSPRVVAVVSATYFGIQKIAFYNDEDPTLIITTFGTFHRGRFIVFECFQEIYVIDCRIPSAFGYGDMTATYSCTGWFTSNSSSKTETLVTTVYLSPSNADPNAMHGPENHQGFNSEYNPGFYSEDNPGSHTEQNPGFYSEYNPDFNCLWDNGKLEICPVVQPIKV